MERQLAARPSLWHLQNNQPLNHFQGTLVNKTKHFFILITWNAVLCRSLISQNIPRPVTQIEIAQAALILSRIEDMKGTH